MSETEVMVRTERRAFFAEVRRSIFGGHLSQEQVDGMSAILDEWDAGYPKGEGDLRKLGYILGTARGEVGSHMQPIREYGRGAGHAYGATGFYGRGFVQLTWEANYRKMSPIVGVDLVADPDKALDPKTAAKVIIQGMLRGLFTGKRLSHFFTGSASDWTGARRIVNGTDRASEFAIYGQQFYAALVKARAELPAPPMPQPKEPKALNMNVTLPPPGKIAAVAGGLGGIALTLGFPQVAALLGLVTPENIQALAQIVALGGTLGTIVGGLLPSRHA